MQGSWLKHFKLTALSWEWISFLRDRVQIESGVEGSHQSSSACVSPCCDRHLSILGLIGRKNEADRLKEAQKKLSHNEASPSHTNTYSSATGFLSREEFGKMFVYSVWPQARRVHLCWYRAHWLLMYLRFHTHYWLTGSFTGYSVAPCLWSI